MTWLDPHMSEWVHQPTPFMSVASACQFGDDWEESWLFACNHHCIHEVAAACPHPKRTHQQVAGAKLPDGSFFSRLAAAYPISLADKLASTFCPFLRRGGLVVALADWIQHIPRNPTSVHAPSDGLKMVAAHPVQLYGHFHNIQIGSKLDTHDICESSTLAESLGVRIHGITGRVQPTAARDWRLDGALKALEMRPVITGEHLQVIVGHMTVRALIHRGLMCIIYIFIEQSFERSSVFGQAHCYIPCAGQPWSTHLRPITISISIWHTAGL